MAEARNEAHEHGDAELFGELETVAGHVVALLLVGGLKRGDESKLGVETRVLLVLGGVHRGVVGNDYKQTAVGAGHAGIDECVGGYVHADVLHRHDGAFAAERHTKSFLDGGFLVRRPMRVDGTLFCERMHLHKFKDFSRRSAGVGVGTRESGIERTEGKRFVAEQ